MLMCRIKELKSHSISLYGQSDSSSMPLTNIISRSNPAAPSMVPTSNPENSLLDTNPHPFPVDYHVYGPVENQPTNERTILSGEKERQGDYVFTANVPGEYRFCFDNTISTFADKVVDFEVTVENEHRPAAIPSKQGSTPEQTSVLEDSISKISSLLSSVARSQKYFRTRENRNFSTVRSTEKRIWNFSLIESGLMVGMAGLQVFVVRMFFTGGRKGEFSFSSLRS